MAEEERSIFSEKAEHNDVLYPAGQLSTKYAHVYQVYRRSNYSRAVYVHSCLGNFIMVRSLVECGADIEYTEICEGTSCVHTVWFNKPLFLYLLSVGARCNRRCKGGSTALHYYCEMPIIYNIRQLIKQGAIIRRDECDCSPIEFAAACASKQNVQFLAEYFDNADTPTFARHSSKRKSDHSHVVDMLEKVDAYKYLGASLPANQEENTLLAWSTAISTCEEAGISLKRGVKWTHSCKHCIWSNTCESEQSTQSITSVDAWDAVKVDAQEMVTGMELLQRATRSGRPTRMSTFLSYFQCPTSPPGRWFRSVVYHTVFKMKRCCGLDKAHLVKWQQLQMELQSLYKCQETLLSDHSNICLDRQNNVFSRSNVLLSNFQRINILRQGNNSVNHGNGTFKELRNKGELMKSTPTADAVLGIEPTCFVQTRQLENDVDPRSYYLQRQWLINNYCTPPRINFRGSYHVCTICCHMVVHVGGLIGLQSKRTTLPMSEKTTDSRCKRCRLQLHKIEKRPSDDLKRSEKIGGYHSYRGVTSPARAAAAVPSAQALATKVYPHCGLAPEQHPLLQRLRQSCEEVFGHARELTSRDDIAEFQSNSDALQLQKLVLSIPIKIKYPRFWINDPAIGEAMRNDFYAYANVWRYTCDFLRIFFRLNQYMCVKAIEDNTASISHALQEMNGISIDAGLIVDYLELTIDCIESLCSTTDEMSYLGHQECRDLNFDDLIRDLLKASVELMSLILMYYLPEVPFKKSFLQGNCLIELVTKEYDHRRNEMDSHVPSFQVFEKIKELAIDSDDIDVTSLKQEFPSSTVIHKFISQVRRLVFLDPRSYKDQSLIYWACIPAAMIFARNYFGSYCQTLAVTLLLRLGANINFVDKHGQTVVGYILKENIDEMKLMHHVLAVMQEAGAHLDAYIRPHAGGDLDERLCDFLQEYIISLTSNERLTGLAATIIRRDGLTSCDQQIKAYLPAHLLTFLHLH